MKKIPVKSAVSFIVGALFLIPLVCCCLGTNALGDSMKAAAFSIVPPKAHETSCHGTADASSHHNPSRSELCECLKLTGISPDIGLISGKPKFQESLLKFSKNALPYQLFSDLLVSHRQLRGAYFSSSPPIQLSSLPLYLQNSILQI